ncbi:MAG: flagellin lysine-N-methylase [Oscillospiraceae bacterium]|nr:flagellin lysine-N-methylase [Oscillospiraceae bacterium]
MRYIKPHYYDKFSCLADQCPDTCCAGWAIMIDEESLKYYSRVKGPFGNRLKNSVNWEDGSFLQYERRCSFLNEENLCDLYRELGPDALCDTCRRYPRHVEEFEGLRELSLSLSCPEAARMILNCREPVRFLWEETDEEDEEFEDMDLLLFTQLEDARDVMLKILQDRSAFVDERLQIIRCMARDIQNEIDKEEYFTIDKTINKYNKKENNFLLKEKTDKKDFMQKCRDFQVFRKMETLRETWRKFLDDTWEHLFLAGEESYETLRAEFEADFLGEKEREEAWECMREQLAVFFLYTYFCGAVYDGYIYAKAALAAFSVEWLKEFSMARWLENGKQLELQEVTELSWKYAREVEHSDVNLGILMEWLDEEMQE